MRKMKDAIGWRWRKGTNIEGREKISFVYRKGLKAYTEG